MIKEIKRMKRSRCLHFAAVSLLALFTLPVISARERVLGSEQGPSLVHTCLITKNMTGLVKFYTLVLQRDAQMSGDDYAEFHTDVGVLAIFSARAQDRYIPGSATAAQNRSVVLEFRVADVDREYKRLQDIVKIWVKPPSTQPWGTRSIYFRDPDGNLVDFYSRPDAP
jgi:catechol 2,3-dioxygenase-like lactoylglutathione lyase family enzyme